MNTARLLRTFAVAATLVALVVASLALPAAARSPKSTGKGKAPVVQTTKGKAAAAKARKAARFVATGTVVANADGVLTVAVEGGYKDLHGTEQAIAVPETAKVTRDEAAATLDEVLPGDSVSVRGSRTADGLVATHVNATAPEPVEEEPTEEVTEEPTEEVTEDPTESLDEPLLP